MLKQNVSSLENDVIFTVSPEDGGKVGIKNTKPKDRFVVSKPIKRELDTSGGGLAGNFQYDLSTLFDSFYYYKEGSRVYLQGRLLLKPNNTYQIKDIICVLPVNYRPLKLQLIKTECFFITDAGVNIYRTCSILIKPTGIISIEYLGSGNNLDVFPVYNGNSITDPSPIGLGAYSIHFDNISFIVEQTVTI